MKWIKVSNYKDLSEEAAKIMKERINNKPNLTIGLATGSTPEGLYKELIKAYKQGELSFSEVTSYNLDEYIGLDINSPQSYYQFMFQKLFNNVDIQKEKIHIPNGNTKDLQVECVQYEELIKNSGGIDIQVLGIGNNGHIAFNEPGTSFDAKTHVVELDESTIAANARFFNNKDEVPVQAITMGIGTIMKSKEILLLISGKGKQEAIEKLKSGVVTEDFPASILHKHPNVTVIITNN